MQDNGGVHGVVVAASSVSRRLRLIHRRGNTVPWLQSAPHYKTACRLMPLSGFPLPPCTCRSGLCCCTGRGDGTLVARLTRWPAHLSKL